MTSTESVEEEFQAFGTSFESTTVAEEMATLCRMFQIPPDDMAMKFLTFLEGKRIPVLSMEIVKQFQTKCLEKARAQPVIVHASPAPKPKQPFALGSAFKTPLGNRSAHNRRGTGSASGKPKDSLNDDDLMVGGLSFDENGASSAKKPLIHFNERSNRGEILSSYGTVPGEKGSWSDLPRAKGGVHVVPQDPAVYLSQDYPCMFVHYQDVAMTLTDKIDELGYQIASAKTIPGFTSPLTIGSSDKVFALGRILPNEDGGLSAHHIVLQTSSAMYKGAISQLDVGLVNDYNLFPGQIVVAKGNGNGRAFVASELIPGSLPPKVPIKRKSDSLHIVAACGPYQMQDDPVPDPLTDLIKDLDKSQPDVLILMGPFLDEKLVESDAFISDNVTIEDYFRGLMRLIFDEVVTKRNIHLILVPSVGQLVDFPVYPVPAFQPETCFVDFDSFSDTELLQKVTFAPEPSLLNINGVVVGITSTDIIKHIKQRGLSKSNSGDWASRIVGNLLLQQSFYPVYPPEIPADIPALHQHAKITQKPHLLITPSCLPTFVKNVEGTVCVNPGKLSKGQSGGSFSRIHISLGDIGTECTDITANTAVQVVRI